MIRPSLRLRASIVAGLLVAGALLTACTASHPQSHNQAPASPVTSPVSATTVDKTFTVYDSSGAITATVHEDVSGDCWTNSIADPSAVTYRCMAANQIFDPCFAPPSQPHPKTVVCFADPWSSGVLMTLTAPLPASDSATRQMPWAIQLVNGARCVAATGTVDQVGSIELDYICGATAEAGLGKSAGAGAALNVEYRSSPTQPLQSVAVSTAWR